MQIVKLALSRPYTFVVMALLIVVLGITTIQRTPVDIFPNIDIPVVTVIWSFTGISAPEIANRIVTICERAMTTTVNDIEHIESQSYPGASAIRVFFQPGARVEAGVAQVTAINQTLLRAMPPGTTPPAVLRYSASSVPVLQLGLSSPTLTEQQLYDLGLNFVRTQLATVQGAQVPLPYGGKARSVMVDLNLQALTARGLSPVDVSNALNLQNLVLPAGTMKMGVKEYDVKLNASTDAVDALNDLPVTSQRGTVIRMRDVASVRDGYSVQTNQVHQDGRRGALLVVLKSGNASTISVVERVKSALPRILSTLPPDFHIQPLFDQSIFVQASITGVVHEATIAGLLTALMILLFLGSWRSTLVVATSIPLSILTSLIVLSACGQSINVMTLGGLALAVGILVDDATVAVENIYRHLSLGASLYDAVVEGTQEIAVPTLVSTLSICVVFISVVFLTGPAKFLFTPMAMAVVFAMLASYLLSRTLVPLMIFHLLPKERPGGLITRLHHTFEAGFDRFQKLYEAILQSVLSGRKTTLLVFAGIFALGGVLLPFVGEDFFPSVDAGTFRLKVRAPAGTRLEETEKMFLDIESDLRTMFPGQIDMVLDNIGLPQGGVNLAFSDSANVGPYEGEILVKLVANHQPTPDLVRTIRREMPVRYPRCQFFFQPADIVTQILNFGVPAPIDIQVTGKDPGNYALARKIAARVRDIPGAVDVRVQQVVDAPAILVNVDRERSSTIGLTQREVASNMLIALSGSGQTAPNFWLDPKTGVSYPVAVQAPQYRLDSLNELKNIPIGTTQVLGNLASLSRSQSQQLVSHYNVQPVFDVMASVQDRDLGGVGRDVDKVLEEFKKELPRGTFLSVRGQIDSMRNAFSSLLLGIAFAIMFVYLLMVVNFQSWVDPFIIITALPGALTGVVFMLFATGVTFSVPSLMGVIVCVGVATANSILMVTFANHRMEQGDTPLQAALAAGETRLRPICMTALAMIIGMVPMALGLGEGGEQNAPLGLAVIGGLMLATVCTLFFVPVNFTLMKKART